MNLYELSEAILVLWVVCGFLGVVILWMRCGIEMILQASLNEPSIILGPLLCGFFFGPFFLYMVATVHSSLVEQDDPEE